MVPKILSSSYRVPNTLLMLLALAAVFSWAPPAESVASLAYSWSCSSRYCSFYVTTNNHGAYKWSFGDGTSSSKSTSTTATHFYNVPLDDQFHSFQVSLAGYPALSSGSPDNIATCTISVFASDFGAGTSGSCSA